MNYKNVEDEIVTRLAPLVTAGYEVNAMPESQAENMQPKHRGMITIQVGNAKFSEPTTTAPATIQEEDVFVEVILRSKWLRSAGGIYDMHEACRLLLMGWRGRDFRTPFRGIEFGGIDPKELADSLFTYTFRIAASTMSVEDNSCDDAIAVLITQITMSDQITANALPTLELLASAYNVDSAGDSVTLIWVTDNATVVSLDNGIGIVTEDGTATATIPANTTFILSATNSVGTSTASVTITVGAACAAGEARNSAGTVLASVPSGGFVVISDVTLSNSDDSWTAAGVVGVNHEIPDTQVQLNGSNIFTHPSVKTLTINVAQDGNPVGSWNGAEVDIPACVPILTAAVTIYSDAGHTTPITTMAFGDTVYLKIATTNGTPTSYTFWIPKQNGTFTQVTQGTDNYSWTVDVFGSFVLEGSACNATQDATDHDGYAFTASGLILDSIVSTPKWGVSTRLISAAFSGLPIINIRRSGGSAQSDFTSTELTDGTAEAWVVAGGGTQHGYVAILYDQSGNGNNRGNSTASRQQQIITSGVLNVDSNGNAVMHGVSGDYPCMPLSGSNGLTGTNGAGFWVCKPVSTSQTWRALGGVGGYGSLRCLHNDGLYSQLIGGDAYHNGSIQGSNMIAATGVESVINCIRLIWTAHTAWDNIGTFIGEFAYLNTTGFWSESIVFDTFTDSDRIDIETDQNAHYGYY